MTEYERKAYLYMRRLVWAGPNRFQRWFWDLYYKFRY